MKKTLTTLLAVASYIIVALAQTGEPDLSFNPGDFGNGYGDGANSSVRCIAVQADKKIIIGGDFTTYNGITATRIARLMADGVPDTSFNSVAAANNSVYACQVQPDGKILLAGTFATVNGSNLNRIARLNIDGTTDTSFHPGSGTNNTIYAMLLQPDGKIIIAGMFTSYNGTSINRIARINSDGSLDTGFTPGTAANNTINTLAFQADGKILLGGNFTTYNATARARIARINTDGTLDATFTPGTGANNTVNSIVLTTGGKILAGGLFTTYGGIARNRIAGINADGTLDTGFVPGTGASGAVNAISVQPDGKAVLAGDFFSYNGTAVYRMCRVTANGSLDLNYRSTGTFTGTILALTLQADTMLLTGGSFTDGAGLPRNRIVRLHPDGSNDNGFNPGTGSGQTVYSFFDQSAEKLIIAGVFTHYNGTPANHIARLQMDGSLDTSFHTGTGANSLILAATLQSDQKILIGGGFMSYNGTARNNIARLNADGSLDPSFDPGSGANSTVYALAVQPDGKILVGGNFTTFNGTTMNYLARLNADGSLDPGFTPGTGPDGYIYTIALQGDGKILIGGSFMSYNGTAVNNFARINTDGSLDGTFSSGTNGEVFTIAVRYDGKIFVGGAFTVYLSTVRNYFAALNSDGSLDNGFFHSTEANDVVRSIAVDPGGMILVGGNFTTYNGIARNRIARLDFFGNLDPNFNTGTGANAIIYKVGVQWNGRVLIGGNFINYNGIGRNRVARLFQDCGYSSISAVTAWTNNICANDTITLKAQGVIVGAGATLTWYDGPNGSGNNLGTGNPKTFTPIASTTYYARLAGTCNAVEANRHINVRPAYLTINPQTICPGGDYSINGHTYSLPGTYFDTLVSVQACDSIIQTELALGAEYNTIQYDTLCNGNSVVWQGSTYTLPGTYHANYTTAAGCDSLFTLELTVFPVYSFEQYDTICSGQSFLWQGNSYTNGGTYHANYLSKHACDSSYTLYLHALPAYSLAEDASICPGTSYLWHGESYNSAGTYCDTLQSSQGCDSIFTLHLSLYPEFAFTNYDTLCGSGPYNWQGNAYTSGGEYHANYSTAHGCDSTYTLYLSAFPAYHVDVYDTIGDGESLSWQGTVYTGAGVYHKLYSAQTGCDSTFTLYLTKIFEPGQLCNWKYYKQVNLDNSGNPETLTDYSVLLIMNTSELIAQGKMNADGSDLRFTTNFADNLSYWIEPGIQNEFGMNDTATHLWIKAPTITGASTTALYIFYGNPAATAASNISNAFLFGDDFNDNTVDATKWSLFLDNQGQIIEQNQRLEHNSPASDPQSNSAISSREAFTGPLVMEGQFKKGGHVYRGVGLTASHSDYSNRVLCGWQDWGGFGADVSVDGVVTGTTFRDDSWSRFNNPEYYVKIYRRPDSTFRITEEIPAFEPDGYKYYEAMITTNKMPLTTPLRVEAYDAVWRFASGLLTRYEDDIRIRKYSQPEPTTSITGAEIPTQPVFLTSDTICGGNPYLWQDFAYFTSTDDTLNYTSFLGCDSTYILHLLVNPVFAFEEHDTLCNGSVYSWQGNSYSTGGVFTADYTSMQGCDSTYSLYLTLQTIDTSVSVNGLLLTANESGATYQWLDCQNGYAPLTGETGQEFTVSTNGQYAVAIQHYECTDTSSCIGVYIVDVATQTESVIRILPNPFSDELRIETEGIDGPMELEIINALGQRLYKGSFTGRGRIHTGHFAPGVYVIRYGNGQTRGVQRLIRQ